jgi:hypothetical protein
MNLREGLDWKAQKASQSICAMPMPTDAENKVLFASRKDLYGAIDTLSTKALGVLQENGVFACVLFLRTRREKESPVTEEIMKTLHELAEAFGGEQQCMGVDSLLRYYSDQIAGDLDRLMLTRSVWEQTLIYVRYSAKALKK